MVGRDQESQPETSRQWGENALAAFAIRAFVMVGPLLLAFIVTWTLSKQWTAPETIVDSLLRFAALAAVATVVAAAADRVARRLLPLAALLRLTLVFPDEAPSRFAIALRSNSTKKLESRLAQLDSATATTTESEAAQIIVELAAALSKHDRVTRGHSERVRAYTALIADEIGLSPEDSNRLQWAGLIHDIGKLRIDEQILNKKGKLTDREYEIIKAHPAEGMRIAEPLRDFLGPWINAVGEHHERWDGGGYPRGLSGNQISLGARIVAVADVYDVITAARSYKAPESPAFAREEIARCAGSQFDPDVVRAFLNIGLGKVRRSMWPLSWAIQIPFLGTAVTAPIAQTVVASVVTLATATGVAVAGGGLAPILDAPVAIAFVETQAAPSSESLALSPVGSASAEPTRVGPVFDAGASNPEPISDVGSAVAAPTSTEPETTSTVPASSSSTTTTSTTIAAPASTSSTVATTTTAKPATTTTTTLQVTTTTTAAPTTTTTISTAPVDDCERLNAGEQDFTAADLQGCEVGAIDLSDVVFDAADLSGVRFAGTDLTNARFYEAELDGAVFTNVAATNAYMKKTTGSNVVIKDSDFSESVFYSAELVDATFTNTTFVNATFAHTNYGDAEFLGLTATNVDFAGADLQRVVFERASLIDVSFDEAKLQGADFRESSHDASSFVLAKLADADFRSAVITESVFDNAIATEDSVTFEQADITNTSMKAVQFPHAKFIGAALEEVEMNQANFAEANFNEVAAYAVFTTGGDFSDTTWRNAHIEGLDMTASSFKRADFKYTVGVPQNFSSALLEGARCPTGEIVGENWPSCW